MGTAAALTKQETQQTVYQTTTWLTEKTTHEIITKSKRQPPTVLVCFFFVGLSITKYTHMLKHLVWSKVLF